MIFLRIVDEFFSGFRAKFQKRVTSVDFQSNLRKQIRKLPKFLKFVKSKLFNFIQFFSIVTLVADRWRGGDRRGGRRRRPGPRRGRHGQAHRRPTA